MADGTNNMPDQTQALLALQQYSQQQSGNGKPAYLFGVLPMDTKVGLGFSSEGLVGKMIMPKKGGKPGLAEKIFNSVMEDCKKIAEGAGVMYSGNVTNGEMPISGLNNGGDSFVASVSSSRNGSQDVEIS